jgi:serine/threonine-protein kinase
VLLLPGGRRADDDRASQIVTEQDEPGDADADRTVFRPASTPPAGGTAMPVPPPGAQQTTSLSGDAARTAMPGSFVPMAPRTGDAHIQVGDVLNHIFEVKRFIARGGMGEVFEGCNVNSDERVAIKVMLPALAADPSVQAMFRKEARTLTRLSHPALVAYRVLAQEPQLGVFYIVTEYIDGANLSDVLDKVKATPAELLALTRRLADGLRAAHALGAIHRDMSPDNVLLEDGKLAQARIIDFGIAKDLDPGAKTIIGDGFAGKLGYVAPEQLGDFDREVGPWSDVYGLGLVILAVALGRNVDMGTNFVDAIDKRRKGVDLSAVPDQVRPVLEKMLKPNPAERLRSMDEVIAAVDAASAAPAKAEPKPAVPSEPVRVSAPISATNEGGGNRKLILGGVAGAVLLLAGGAFLAFGGGNDAAPEVAATAPVASPTASTNDPTTVARAAVTKILPNLECTWLDLTNATMTADGLAVSLAGVAGHPADAQAAVSKAVTDAGAPLASADFADVAPITGTECASIDALRAIRSTGKTHLSVPQRKFEMSRLADGEYAGQIGARSVINLDIGDPSQNFALYGIEPNGAISALVADRKAFAEIPKTGDPIADLGGDRYRLQIDANHTGWSGIILLTGKSGFSDSYVVAGPGARTPEWRKRFADAAAAGEWKAEMVWFKMVNELPD